MLYCLTTYQVSVSSFVCRWVSCVSHHCCLISFGAVTDWLICHDLVAEDLFLLFPVDDIHSAEEFKSVGTHFTTFCCQKCHAVLFPCLYCFPSLCQQKCSCLSEWGTQSWDQLAFFIFPPAVFFLWLNFSIWCVVQLNRCFCYHTELSGWVKGGDRLGVTYLRVGNRATTSFGGNA